jgi:hypothetical protein
MPLVRIKDDLGKKEGDAIGSLGRGGCGSGQNPASSPGFLAGKGVGEVEGLTGARFETGVGVEGLPVMAGGGTRRRRPLELLSRRAPGLGKEKGSAVSSGRGREGVEKLWPAGAGSDGGAPHGRDGGLVACARTAGHGFYSPREQARLQAFAAKGVPRASMPWYGERRWLACVHRTCDRPRDSTGGEYGAGTVWHVSLGDGRKGDRRLWPRGGGKRARTDAKAGTALCARRRRSR